jgi:hypothetical protein
MEEQGDGVCGHGMSLEVESDDGCRLVDGDASFP